MCAIIRLMVNDSKEESKLYPNLLMFVSGNPGSPTHKAAQDQLHKSNVWQCCSQSWVICIVCLMPSDSSTSGILTK